MLNAQKDGMYWLNHKYNLFELASDADNSWEDSSAVNAYINIRDILTFWNQRLNLSGFDETQTDVINVLTNTKLDNAQAYSITNYRPMQFGFIVIGDKYDGAFDVIAHEFNHLVIGTYAELGKGYTYAEAALLNEGLSDLMAELCEEYTFGETDWITGNGLRNHADPYASQNPYERDGINWSNTKGYDISEYAHTNSTIIGHMGYLMASGRIQEAVNIEPLDTAKLAKLIFNTYLFLDENMLLNEYAKALYITAIEMYKNGELSAKQVRCVYEAINKVGLTLEFDISNGLTEDFLYLSGSILDEYSYTATEREIIENEKLFGQVKQGYVISSFSEETDRILPDPESGRFADKVHYNVVLTNLANPKETFKCTIRITGAQNIPRVYVPFISEPITVNKLVIAEDGPVYSSGGSDFDYFVYALDNEGKLLLNQKGNPSLIMIFGESIEDVHFRVWFNQDESTVLIEHAQSMYYKSDRGSQLTYALYRIDSSSDFSLVKRAVLNGYSFDQTSRRMYYDSNVYFYKNGELFDTADYNSQSLVSQLNSFFKENGISFNSYNTIQPDGYNGNDYAFSYPLATYDDGEIVFDSDYSKVYSRSSIIQQYYVPMEVRQKSQDTSAAIEETSEQDIDVLLTDLQKEIGPLIKVSTIKNSDDSYKETYKDNGYLTVLIEAAKDGKLKSVTLYDSDYFNSGIDFKIDKFAPTKSMEAFYEAVCKCKVLVLNPNDHKSMLEWKYNDEAQKEINNDFFFMKESKIIEKTFGGKVKVEYCKVLESGFWMTSYMKFEFVPE